MKFIGMLWQIPNDNTSFTAKVEAAADYYAAKYGPRPTLVFVNPEIYKTNKDQAPAGIVIQPNQHIANNNFWLGVTQ